MGLINRVCFVFVTVISLGTNTAGATAPIVYGQAAYQSPVQGDPGDLLILPGYGFATTDIVVYQSLGDTTQPLAAPSTIQADSTADSGVAPVVSTLNVPHSLSVMLPSVMRSGQSYALWVRNQSGEWSNGVLINDARPLWISPDTAYTTATLANLPRNLKVVGRNLQAAAGVATQVRLTGPLTYTLSAADDGDPSTAIERYAAIVTLPSGMQQGNYTVQVSRDGVSWVGLSGQTLSVLADPVQPNVFSVGAYGGCVPDDGVDDTPCIVSAIAAAKANGGGLVTFSAGLWNLSNSSTSGVTYDGILLPVGVSLMGAGAQYTTVQRDSTWDLQTPAFTAQGSNSISGFRFSEGRIYQVASGQSPSAASYLRLGVRNDRVNAYGAKGPSVTSHVVITRNIFDKNMWGIADAGLPVDHLFVTYNEFGAYVTGLAPGGYPSTRFHIDDSVVDFNTFKPGSYVDATYGQGTIASQIGAGRRVDFSGNLADGTSTQYLYNPATDAKGWRAAFFWTLRNNEEEILISQNVATCTGDKGGDGEAIVFDNNHNAAGFSAAQAVLAATANTVTVSGSFVTQFEGLTLPADYFTEHWVQVAQGPGLGQVRRIVSYMSGSPLTITVSPAWDVVPQAGSVIVVARQVWQSAIVDNTVDQRQPLCQKSNPNKPSGGIISYYSQTADSTIEGNVQHDTNGISLNHTYVVTDSTLNTVAQTRFHTFVEVRANTIDHEYNWQSACSWSGIQLYYGASPTSGFPPPVAGYGAIIAHNSITQADGFKGGAIDLANVWYEGPAPSNWDVIESPLIFLRKPEPARGNQHLRFTGLARGVARQLLQ